MKKVNYVNKTTNKKQSILIALITAVLCLIIIVVSGIYTANDTKSADEISTVSYEDEIIENEPDNEPESVKIPQKDNKSTSEGGVLKVSDVPTEKFELIMPIKYEERKIQKIFSLDALIYSVTMEDYRIHTGLDIACPINTHVYSAGDGTITFAGEDAFMGYTIEIEHSGGYKTVYSNLSSCDMVENGQSIKKGEIIATTGQTASSEILDAPHIHFEVLKDGKHINPLDIII